MTVTCKTCWCDPCVCAQSASRAAYGSPPAIEVAAGGPNFAASAWAPVKPSELSTGIKPAVSWSDDLRRIMELPRRPPPVIGTRASDEITEMMNQRLRRHNPSCRCQAKYQRACITSLLPIQAWALYELATVQGLIGSLAVGSGKTVVGLEAALVLPNCKHAVLLCPPTLVEQMVREYLLLSEHFWVPELITHGRVDFTSGKMMPGVPSGAPKLHIFPYSLLSQAENTEWLDKMAPDAMFADEVHLLRDISASRTKRVLRYFAAHPTTRFAGWTGSLSDGKLEDYAHLMALSLRLRAPTPIEPDAVREWGRALDADNWLADPGALSAICAPGENVRDGFRRLLHESYGFVHTKHASIPNKLEIVERKVDVPPAVLRVLADTRSTWIRPDYLSHGGTLADGGEEFTEPMALNRCLRELACGFFYRWKFPRGEPVALIEEWLAVRKAWNKELREKLKDNQPHMDSPLLCTRAAARAYGDELVTLIDEYGHAKTERVERDARLPQWRADNWPAWRDIRDQVKPASEAVRYDDFLVRDAAKWGLENRGIVWYDKREFGQWIAERSGLPIYGGGPSGGGLLDEDGRIVETGARSVLLSIKAHGTGRDGLQRIFDDQLVANPMASAVGFEQLLGRLHRLGQQSEVVRASVYRHTPELDKFMRKALLRAAYITGTLGADQKLTRGISDELREALAADPDDGVIDGDAE